MFVYIQMHLHQCLLKLLQEMHVYIHTDSLVHFQVLKISTKSQVTIKLFSYELYTTVQNDNRVFAITCY